MKVAFFHPYLRAVGGAEVLLARQARYLAASNFDVCIATEAYEPQRWSRLLDGVPVRVAARGAWKEWLPFVPVRKKLQWKVERAAPNLHDRDVVIAHNYPCSVQ